MQYKIKLELDGNINTDTVFGSNVDINICKDIIHQLISSTLYNKVGIYGKLDISLDKCD